MVNATPWLHYPVERDVAPIVTYLTETEKTAQPSTYTFHPVYIPKKRLKFCCITELLSVQFVASTCGAAASVGRFFNVN